MIRAVLGVLVLAASAEAAGACSLATAKLFLPVRDKVIEHFVGELPEQLPAPTVKIVEVTRGRTDSGESCEDAGILRLSLELPKSSGFAISEVGFYFRLLSGQLPDTIFPTVPVVGLIAENKMEVLLAWLDGHPRRQRPLAAKVEVFAVANDLAIGPPTKFELRGPAGKVSID